MSNKQADQIIIPLGGEYFIADPDVAIPTTVAMALAIKDGTTAGWAGLGWVSEEGAPISKETEKLEIPAWGSGGNAVKTKVTKRTFNFGGTLLQSNAMNVSTWFGATDFAPDGGVAPNAGYRADIEIDTPSIEKALMVIWTMDGHPMALPFKKVNIDADGDLTIVDTDAQKYGLAITSMAPDTGTILGSILTTHPAFAPDAP